jgi:carbon-monoxide dehydrogenase small subunit
MNALTVDEKAKLGATTVSPGWTSRTIEAISSAVVPEFVSITFWQSSATGTKHGCELGECGTCAVLVDGRSILSCLMLGLDAAGREVKTIEGMANGAELHPLQQTFADLGAAQCGYCSPGFLLVAEELLLKSPNPCRSEIQEALSGNLCRCTGYIKIYEAVELAAARMRGEEMELPKESVYGLD